MRLTILLFSAVFAAMMSLFPVLSRGASNDFILSLCGTRIENNSAREGGGAIFFVSNDRSGSLIIKDSYLAANPSGRFETAGYPGIFVLAAGAPVVINSTIKE